MAFATKPELAQRMLARLLDGGVDVGWFTADEAYGDNPGLRTGLAGVGLKYVMAISCDHRFTTQPDLLGLTSWFIGAARLRVLVDLRDACLADGMGLRVVADQWAVVRPLVLTGLDRMFDRRPALI